MLNRNINSIIYQSYQKLGELGYKIARNSSEGLMGTKHLNALYDRAIQIDNLLYTIVENAEVQGNSIYRVIGVSDSDINKLLSCLEQLSGIHDYPVAPFAISKNITKLSIAGVGTQGAPGQNGVSSYNAVVFAEDDQGLGLSTTPHPTRPYIAFKTSTALIPITPATFTGLWVRYIGTAGPDGEDGEDGTTYYTYIRYASDINGTNFSATPDVNRKYVGYLVTTTDQLGNPSSALFNGLWTKYIGDNGINGTNGTNGKTILVTSGAPDNAIGTDGDVAIDSTNWRIHAPKAGGVWPAGVNLVGPQGATGAAGSNGTNGANGSSAYLYLAWADDASGTGFTLTFDPNKQWIGVLPSTSEILSPTVSNFIGRWSKYRGDGDRWATTSTSTLTIGTGTKALIVATGLAYTTGQKIVVAVDNDPSNRMEGLVIGYDQVTGQFTATITDSFGSGTYSSWDVNLQGAPTVAPTTDSYFAEIQTNAGAGTQATSTSFTKLTQFTANGNFNNGMIPDHANDNITSSVAGQFALFAALTVSSVAGGTFEFQFFRNGVALPATKQKVVLPAANIPGSFSLKALKAILSNDVLDVRVRATAGTPDIVLEEGTFGMYTTGTPSTPEYSKFGGTNFDIGVGVIIDSFSTTLGDAIIWEYKIKKGNNLVTGRIQGTWDGSGNINETNTYTAQLGTIDVTLNVDINGGNVRLLADITSDDWEISGNRYIL
jgi:hypothetical protein